MALIFVVEDNENLREAVSSFLKLEGFSVKEFGVIKDVYSSIKELKPDLIVLDVMLPDGDGFILAKQIRETFVTPIIFVTARDTESNRITGFEIGCDDYVVKPFSTKELVLRVKAVLKRGGVSLSNTTKWTLGSDTLEVDSKKHKVLTNGKESILTATEWKILNYLIEYNGVLIDRQRLLTNCLDYGIEMSERTVITHIKNLRAKIGPGEWIETVRGFGYRFIGMGNET